MIASSNPGSPRRAIFTICSNNYLPMASVLLASAAEHHPEADLFLCLVDQLDLASMAYGELAEIVPLDVLGIADPAEFTFRYDVMELNTAAKPFMLLYLLERRGFEQVIYLDPDIQIFAPLHSVVAALDEGASAVITPHCCGPSERGTGPDDRVFLLAGAYNLGFLAVRACEEIAELVHWWARRLRWDCVNDQAGGLFVDQRFVDLAPCFAPRLRVSYDTTLNVAYWNLAQRSLAYTPPGWTIGGKALTFFHFSGFDPFVPGRLSRHSDEFVAPFDPALNSLLDLYAASLLTAGFGTTPMPSYAYGRFASGVPIPDCARRMMRDRHRVWPQDPFNTVEAYLSLPSPHATAEASPFLVTNLLHDLHSRSAWLRATHDLAVPADVSALVTWFVRHGAAEAGLDPRLVSPVAERFGSGSRTAASRPLPPPAAGDADATVIGYLQTTSGVGEAARMTLQALATTPGLHARGLDVTLGVVADRLERSCAALLEPAATGRIQILHVNADQLPLVLDAMAAQLRPGAYRIAVPFWELESLPAVWDAAFTGVDEIWAPSRFVQLALLRRLDRPVLFMPQPVSALVALPGGRPAFGLPSRVFLFFFAFDLLSFPERKNPAAAIAAFRRAFPNTAEKVGLVIKTINGAQRPEAFAALEQLAAVDPRVVVIDRVLERPDMTRLICACDCLVSLHRSEGFGLLVAEAMMLGKPVIATDYGATTDLLSPATGFPVEYRKVPVAPGAYPHGAGQLWAEPDINHAAWLMRRVMRSPGGSAPQVTAARMQVARTHGVPTVSAARLARLRAIDQWAS